MDFLEKLNFLMDKYNLNKSTLSKSCDIPYTTIDGWYKRGYEGLKLPTLKKLSSYFGISLDYWADDNLIEPIPPQINNFTLTPKDEIELLTDYRTLNDSSKVYVRGVTKGFSISEKIANAKGKTLVFPKSINPTKDFEETFSGLDPEYQQAMLAFIEQLLAKQEESYPHTQENNTIPNIVKAETPDYLTPQAAHNDHEFEPGEQEKMQEDLSNLKIPD